MIKISGTYMLPLIIAVDIQPPSWPFKMKKIALGYYCKVLIKCHIIYNTLKLSYSDE